MSSYNTTKPTGEAHMRHVMEPSDPNVNLLERILSRDNVKQAWKRVKANKGAPGIDNMSIDDFPEFARTHWEGIRNSLFSDRYTSPCRLNEWRFPNLRAAPVRWVFPLLLTG